MPSSDLVHDLPEHSGGIMRSSVPLSMDNRKTKIIMWSLGVLTFIGVIVGFSVGFTRGEKFEAAEVSINSQESASIAAADSSYVMEDEIEVVFTNTNANLYDFIAIGKAGTEVQGHIMSDDDFIAWTYACGSEVECFTTVEEGQVNFDPGRVPAGSYQAYLLVGEEPPYKVKASSEPFLVKAAEVLVPKGTYVYGENISVKFDNPNGAKYDYIAIAVAGSEQDGMFYEENFEEAWIYVCGREDDCDEAVESGEVTFSQGRIMPGIYQAYLIVGGKPPYIVKAASLEFTVVEPPPRNPTAEPTSTFSPTYVPTSEPTFAATYEPTYEYTYYPTAELTYYPTEEMTGGGQVQTAAFGPTAEPTTTFSPTYEGTGTYTPTAEQTYPATAEQASGEPTMTLSPTTEDTGTYGPTVEQIEIAAPGPTAEPTSTGTYEPTAEPTSTGTYEPTAEPTAIGTYEPTAEPTAIGTYEGTTEPTVKEARSAKVESIATSKLTYGLNEPIAISFNNPTPHRFNMIAIDKPGSAQEGRLLDDKEGFADWFYACASKEECEESIGSGTIYFIVTPGKYRAFLIMRGNVDEPPYRILATSETFTVGL